MGKIDTIVSLIEKYDIQSVEDMQDVYVNILNLNHNENIKPSSCYCALIALNKALTTRSALILFILSFLYANQ